MLAVDANDIFSELKVLETSLPNMLTSTSEILEFIKAKYYYPNVSIGYQIPLGSVWFESFGGKGRRDF